MPNVYLTELGQAQAKALARRVTGVDRVYASPLERARQTAKAIAAERGLEVESMGEFNEFDFGQWTGRTFQSLREDSLWASFNAQRISVPAPSGESMSNVCDRAIAGIEKIASAGSEGGCVAIVSHGDVIRSILLYVLSSTLDNYWRLTIDLASISEIEFHSRESIRILRINDTAHLQPSSPTLRASTREEPVA